MGTTSEPGLRVPVATGEPIEWQVGDEQHGDRVLELLVGDEATVADGRLAVAGRHEFDSGVLRFHPTFDLARGQDYVVRTRRGAAPPRLTPFRLPQEATAKRALVTAVYPSGEVLPENVLRFYLHFSASMAPGRAMDFVQLRDECSRPDFAAFMTFKQELWNTDRTRLTLLVDPGRIKKGISSRRGLEPAMIDGRRYTLAVAEGWSTADGSSRLAAFSRSFRIGPGLRRLPRTQMWRWTPPRPGSADQLVITFDRPFDRHLLVDAIELVDGDGRMIDGTSRVGPSETSWSFTPTNRWPVDGPALRVADRLEDVAGNNLRGLVERDLARVSIPPGQPRRTSSR